MKYLAQLQNFFHQHKNESHAVPMKKYMKEQFNFLGIRSPERRALIKLFIKEHGWPPREVVEDVVVGLYSLPYREFHYTAIEMADRLMKKTIPEDIYAIEYLLEYNQWWDSIDFIAVNLAARWLKANPDKAQRYFKRWNESNDVWLNRTAILYQLKYKNDTNTQTLSDAIISHSGSKEFFHQEAIGQALRAYAETDPVWVKDFINNNELPNLSRREALKNLVAV